MVYLPHWPIPSSVGGRQINYETVFERSKIVLKNLGNPHLKLPPTIHVAGTNGKGSTASMIAKIFQTNGYKTHLYTSPHLHDCNERIVINGNKISNQELYLAMEEARLASQNVDLTFMEAFTIGAFIAFANNPADVLILETGMGGRIDITNIIPEKLACVITSISMDHQEYLGDNLAKIALEKSFIIRPNTPAIISHQEDVVNQLLKLVIDDQKAHGYYYKKDFKIEKKLDSGNFDFTWQNKLIFSNLTKPKLIGDHQYHNTANAIACCMSLNNFFNFNFENINKAISSVEWHSRLEKIDNNLSQILPNESELWIDGAHNEGGAKVLSEWIKSQPKMENFIICGFSRGKTKIEFLNKFNNIAKIICIKVNKEPYPEDSSKIASICKENNIEAIDGVDLLEAINFINENFKNTKCRVVICGSLHLARDVLYFNNFC